jgi:predicted metal-dependent phosphoesterase TrpH
MLKVELHAHTDLDPADRIPHSTEQLIDHAASLGYRALAVTLHDRYFAPGPWNAYAAQRGIVLLPGIEKTIGGKHVLLINFPSGCTAVRNFEELAELRTRHGGLVIAPHAFYPTRTALSGALDRYAGLVDAVECNAMYTPRLDFNRRAVAWARDHHKPLVGNTDLHVLAQMGTTYSLVDARPDPDAICEAIRAGRVELRTTPLTELRAAWLFGRMLLGGIRGRLRRRLREL